LPESRKPGFPDAAEKNTNILFFLKHQEKSPVFNAFSTLFQRLCNEKIGFFNAFSALLPMPFVVG
jgi:hypothetical protein